MNASRRRTILGTTIVLVVILTICASLRPAATSPKLSVGIGSYASYSNHLEVVVNLTNAGSVPIVYLVPDPPCPPLGWLATESLGGWTNVDLPHHGLMDWVARLPSGESTAFSFDLPSDTLRWKFGFSFRRLTLDERVAHFPWVRRLCPPLQYALEKRAFRKKYDLRFESRVFEVQPRDGAEKDPAASNLSSSKHPGGRSINQKPNRMRSS
jgi:hypothetical protein